MPRAHNSLVVCQSYLRPGDLHAAAFLMWTTDTTGLELGKVPQVPLGSYLWFPFAYISENYFLLSSWCRHHYASDLVLAVVLWLCIGLLTPQRIVFQDSLDVDTAHSRHGHCIPQPASRLLRPWLPLCTHLPVSANLCTGRSFPAALWCRPTLDWATQWTSLPSISL